MITQQVAAYMIKKMTGVVNKVDELASDETDRQFKEFLRAKKGEVKNEPCGVLITILPL